MPEQYSTLMILGTPVQIDWNTFTGGSSLFIPCVDRARAQRVMEAEAYTHGACVLCKHVIENGVYGLRVWRD